MITLADTLSHLTTLARAARASTTHLVQLECFGGYTLLYHWEGADVPREVEVRFDAAGDAVQATCLDPSLYMNALEEGLSREESDRVSRVSVAADDGLAAISDYLMGRPYARL